MMGYETSTGSFNTRRSRRTINLWTCSPCTLWLGKNMSAESPLATA